MFNEYLTLANRVFAADSEVFAQWHNRSRFVCREKTEKKQRVRKGTEKRAEKRVVEENTKQSRKKTFLAQALIAAIILAVCLTNLSDYIDWLYAQFTIFIQCSCIVTIQLYFITVNLVFYWIPIMFSVFCKYTIIYPIYSKYTNYTQFAIIQLYT